MSETYERIWLQNPNTDPENEWCGETTWCQDKINDSDVEYVRADVVADLRQQLAECQAREKVLRDALESAFGNEYWRPDNAPRVIIQSMQKALAMPSDSTALDTMKKQWQREALLEAAQKLEALDGDRDFEGHWAGEHLRRMADL